MAKQYIVTKQSMHFELHIDGSIEVKPLPSNDFSKETITALAELHETVLDYYRKRIGGGVLEKEAVKYFYMKGFDIKEKGNTNPINPHSL